ncbi:NAD-dependent epimerase/dehydratase family protein [Celeribacter indicus]|uniref:UDP-glucose 4-epimerase n=1 Tax=Celeribacter indicus TaxID=1208324 RepID=A0A0B5E087_9RHOB|nr:NAD-dependent epimerase/dehydratase family protein [Celeribacter indicus]AJE46815.1 UDP-glucose 4-epimerase [Celeribacter indicus]SDW81242.1 UDP-glucose 4-epimerase [Celeribacter indicus]
MTYLVTGGLGVNGAWVTRRLLEAGHPVLVVDRQTDTSLLGEAASSVQIVNADIMDGEAMRALLAKHEVSCIVHMAALIAGLQEDPLRGLTVNTLGTAQLMDAAVKTGVKRFVYTSSRAVYGNITGRNAYPDYEPVVEDQCLAAENVYDVTKLAGELIGRNFAKLGLEFVALRFATIFGPGKLTRHGAMGIYGKIIEGAMAGVPVRIPHGGEERDDVIYVGDVAQACLRAATHAGPAYTAYNISRNTGTTLREFAAEVERQIPGAEIEIGDGLNYFGGDVNYCGILDNRRAVEDLGFSPEYDLGQGIAAYIATLKALGLAPAGA